MERIYAAWQRFTARPLLVDTVLAAVVLAASLGSATVFPFEGPGQSLDLLGLLLIVAGAAPLALRRRHPTAVLVASITIMFWYYSAGYPDGAQFLPGVIALYTVAAHGSRAVAVAVGLLTVLYGPVALLTRPGLGFDFWRDLGMVGWVLATLILGEVARARRAYLEERRAYLEELRARLELVERTREEEARRRAGEERLRIARELHDVLAHNISMINVQAGVAVHLLDQKPEQARPALVAIKDASRDAMREVRAALGMLRQVDGAPGGDAPRAPAPSLAHVDELVAHAATAGVKVRLVVEGIPSGQAHPKLPAGTDVAAYRIVQEALTNVIRHAGTAAADVAITYGHADLRLTIEDDGAGQPVGVPAGTGSGITGMRERAAAAGGELTAGPRPGGGFRVHARLPLRGAA